MKLPPRRAPAPAPTPPANDDDLDFAALMRRDGVTPAAQTPRNKPPRPTKPAQRPTTPSPPPPASRTTTPSPPASRPPTTPAQRPTTPSPPQPTQRPTTPPAKPIQPATPAPTPAQRHATPAAQPAQPEQPTASQLRQLAALRQEHTALLARNSLLTRERDAAQLTTTALQHELTTLRTTTDATITALRNELTARTAELTALRTAADATTSELSALRSELHRTRAALHEAHQPAPRHTLAAALAARELEPDEYAPALALLAASESAAALLDLLETRDPATLAALIDRRLALVCGDPACAPGLGALALTVPRARCEVCGGSDIQRAAHGFIRACQAAGITRVRFVGGSPNYRTKLESLFPPGGPLGVRTTAGDQRIRLSRAKSQQRSDDLVIIWGATELDHATSGAYRSEHGRTEVIAHRGIGRMLALAAARIT